MDSIICGLATVKGREEALKDTVLSIIDQVDKLIVYQNGYKEIFDFLNNGKIEVYSSLDTGIDMGDAGKYYKVSEYRNHYYFSIDDDLIYPSDYVKNMVDKLKIYNNSVIVSHHGRTLNGDAKSYYKDAKIKHKCLDEVVIDDFVQFGGTGVMAFHTSLVKLNFEYLRAPNMADIWVGLYARENNIPILVLSHSAGWIKHSDKFNLNDTIYAKHVNNSIIQDSLIINYDKNRVIRYSDSNVDLCFLIPSYNRYDKLVNLLNQINSYPNTKVIIFNDASTDDRYMNIENTFRNVKVIHNVVNNGKDGYNNTIKTLFSEAEKTNNTYFALLADDFVLCQSFVKNLSQFLNESDIVNIFSIRNEGWGRPGWIDGAFACSKGGISLIKSLIPNMIKTSEGKSTGIWKNITNYFATSNKTKYRLTTLNYSLCQHDGNEDSKLHPKHRLKVPIVAHNFYDDFMGKPIEIISESVVTKGFIKKKSSGGIPNGNPTNEPTIVETPKPTAPVINPKAILPNTPKLHVPEQRISKIHDEIFLNKLRKKKLGFGGRR